MDRKRGKSHRTMGKKAAAQYLGVSEFQVSQMIASGKLRAGRTPGGHTRITLASLNRARRK